jgi:spore coat polysaccharide biosynthesis protein SpsF
MGGGGVVAIVQARMASTRLPGKVLEHAAGRTLLEHVIERLRAATTVDQVLVATSDGAADDPVVAEASRLGVLVHRGSEADVLDRFVGAARRASADVVVRITADCPLIDPAELDRVVASFRAPPEVDYATNHPAEGRRVPLGQAVEVFSTAALERAAKEAIEPHHREHVTPYFYQQPGRFRVRVTHPHGPDRSDARLTVDTPADLAVIRAVLEAVQAQPEPFAMLTALEYLDAHPEIAALNADVRQKSFREAAAPTGSPVASAATARAAPLLIRADAGPRVGAGHAMRMLAVAEAWIELGGSVTVLSAEMPSAIGARFVAAGASLAALPEGTSPGGAADAAATVELCGSLGGGVVLVDGYAFEAPDYLAALRKHGAFTAFIDDHILPDLPVDAVVSPNPLPRPRRDPAGAVVLAGVQYALLRAELHQLPRPPRRFDTRPLRLLLAFGGSDPAALTARAVGVVCASRVADEVTVTALIGPSAPDAVEREVLAAAGARSVRVVRDPPSMAALLGAVDVAVAAAGVSAWELACLGVPALLTWVADNQRPVADALATAGAAWDLGPAQSLDDRRLAERLEAFVGLGDELERMSRAGRAFVDGRGAHRLAHELCRLARAKKERA